MSYETEKYWAERNAFDPRLDWRNGKGNWVDEYIASSDHPHRQLIINALKALNPTSLLEVGCNAGPNLLRIRQELPDIALAGIDPSPVAIAAAQHSIPSAGPRVGSVTNLPFRDSSFHVVLADAVLMYVPPQDWLKAWSEIIRVATRAIILIEWDAPSLDGEIRDFHWARDYSYWLTRAGFPTVAKKKLTEQDWPSKNWERNGYFYIGTV